jgi:3-oxoacyl-[acyl-carrier-protein] synthase II
VGPLGVGSRYSWDRLIKGECGVVKLTDPAYQQCVSRVAGRVPVGTGKHEFDKARLFPASREREVTLSTVFAVQAADEALETAGWRPTPDRPEDQRRTGVVLGSTIIDTDSTLINTAILNKEGYQKVSPYISYRDLLNIPAGAISIEYGLKGPNLALVTASATGLHSIGQGFRFIRDDDADVMLCGGVEAPLIPQVMAGISRIRALSFKYNADPSHSSRPFDEGRDGFALSEGCAMLVLEELNHAKRRGATIYAEIIGVGLSGDAHHVTQPPPDGDGGYRCMALAAKNAKLRPRDIQVVSCHATSTPQGDRAELNAVTKFFADDEGLEQCTIMATKGQTGHLVAATSALESMFAVHALKEGIIPGMPNLFNLDPDLKGQRIPIFPFGPKPRPWNQKRRYLMKNAFGFTGCNTSIVYTNYMEPW